MDGLEITEIAYSELLSVETFRIDSEYFAKEYLNIHNIIKKQKNKFCTFEDLELLVDASAFYPSLEPLYNTGNLPFLRVADVDMVIDYAGAVQIPDDIFEEFKTLRTVKRGDIVLTKGGSVARAGYIDRVCAVSRDLIFINSSKMQEDESIFLFCYLMTSFANKLLLQSSSMTAQPHLTLTLVKNLPMFNPSFEVKSKVSKLYKLSKENLEKSQKLYFDAEELLLEELGLKDFTTSNECVAVKSFSESFGSSGRLDAEYYQLKYDDIIDRVKGYNHGYKKLGAMTTLKKSIEPGSDAYGDEGVQFLRVADLFKHELKEPEIRLSESLFDVEKLDELKPKKGEVLLSKDGSVGIAYAVREDTNFIPSGAIVRLQQITDILPDVLALILNSQVVQLQAERDAGGSILQHWKPSEINEVLVPLLNEKVQKMIAEKISESFSLRAESKKLLEEAKKEVELAIEQGE